MALTQSTCSALSRLPFPIGISAIHIALRVPSIRQLPWKHTHPRRKPGRLSFRICVSVRKSHYERGSVYMLCDRTRGGGWERRGSHLKVAYNITASGVTRNSGDLSAPGRHRPSASDYQRLIPSSPGKVASGNFQRGIRGRVHLSPFLQGRPQAATSDAKF